jgi:microcystin-dependent protein
MSNYYGYDGYPIPTGAILPFVASTTSRIPDSFLPCNGSQYDKRIYPELFAVIGNTFNSGGETAGFFRTPNLVANPYTKPGPISTVVPGTVQFVEEVLLTTNDLPTLALGDFNATINFNPATTPSLYQHDNGNNVQGDDGSGSSFTKANSSTRTTFSVAITGGTDPSYTPPAPVEPCLATVDLGDVIPIGWQFIHIIKAVQVSIAPQILAPAVVPQFPAPQYLYENMAWLNGFTDFNF